MADLPVKTLAQRLRWARICSGLTASGLATRAGINPATVSRLEKGEVSNASATTIAAISDALGIRMAWLWSAEGTEPDPVGIRKHVGAKNG